jgi:hypothetical protein
MHRPLIGLALLSTVASAQVAAPSAVSTPQRGPALWIEELEDGSVMAVDDFAVHHFTDWSDYARSTFFFEHGMRCGTAPAGLDTSGPGMAAASAGDCTSSFNNPDPVYDANGGTLYLIPVVVHVIQAPNGQGFISDAMVQSQIDVLNEDFRAIAGSLGAPGEDTRVEFYLADVDPNGNPTNGITRHVSKQWFQDKGSYAASIGWDTNRYLNIYTNTAGGNLGYAYLPQSGSVGTSYDGVRILWSAFGRNAPIGYPYDLGRTATHEVGHYLGLYHTFQGGCASAASCNTNGDLICDTNPESQPNSYPCTASSCGSSDPTRNYMDYSYDLCMTNFTVEQTRRMRCTLENWRVDLTGGTPPPPPSNTAPVVSISSPSNGATVNAGQSLTLSASASDAEDGNLASQVSWSSSLDGALGTGSGLSVSLSTGTHTLTAAVTDSGGLSDSDQVSVTVQSSGGGGLQAGGSSTKVKGEVVVTVTWSGAAAGDVAIYRDGSLVANAPNTGSFVDETGIKGSGLFSYQVCDSSGACASFQLIY